MKPVRELEVWSKPGQILPAEYGKDDLQHEVSISGIPEGIFLGLSSIPDRIDCENLSSLIEAGDSSQLAFEKFCDENNLKADIQSERSAALFLEYLEGRCLAWIHLSEDVSPSVLLTITKIIQARDHIIVDPAEGA